jgi:GNAT superfamily N-acetyltransferase/acyl-CoA thioesterase
MVKIMTSVMVVQGSCTPRRRADDVVALRPAAASDTEAVVAMVARCSRTTLIHRFHGLSDGAAYFEGQLRDRPSDRALLAWVGSTCVGVATLGVGATGVADLAVLVEDAWQRRGIGTRLTESLLDEAAANGLRIVHADVLSDDRYIVRALGRIGPLKSSIESGIWSIDLSLRPQPSRPTANMPPVGAETPSGGGGDPSSTFTTADVRTTPIVSSKPQAYYLPRGDERYAPTRATESPWDRNAQHGGPPTALLAHVIDQTVEGPLRIGRMSVDFLGPIPLREVVVEVSPIKPGRRVCLTEARMSVDGRVVVTARAWHIATGDGPPATQQQTAPPPLPTPLPPGQTPQRFYPGLDEWGYGESIEWRFTRGSLDSLGPADVWARVGLPLVEGLALTGQDRVLIAADSANGLSLSLPLEQWLSIPPTMTATLLRPPVGEWVHLACRTHLAADGIGLAHADLFDPDGHIGEVAQPLLVQERRPKTGVS